MEVGKISLTVAGENLMASVILSNGNSGSPTEGFASWSRSVDRVHEKFQAIEEAQGVMQYTPTWRDVGRALRFTFIPFGQGAKGAHCTTAPIAAKPGAEEVNVEPRSNPEYAEAMAAKIGPPVSPSELRISHRRKKKEATRKLKNNNIPLTCMFTIGRTKQTCFMSEEDKIEIEYRKFLAQGEVYRDVELKAKAPVAEKPKVLEFRKDESGEHVHTKKRPVTATEVAESPVPTAFALSPTKSKPTFGAVRHSMEDRHRESWLKAHPEAPGPGSYNKEILDPKPPREKHPLFAAASPRPPINNSDGDIPGPGIYSPAYEEGPKKSNGLLCRLPVNCTGVGCTGYHSDGTFMKTTTEMTEIAKHEGSFMLL